MKGRLPSEQKKELLRYSWPLLVETLLVMVIGNVSTILLAKYSDDAAGAVSVANQLIAMFHLVFMIVSTGAGILSAQYIGAGLREKTSRLGGMAIFVSFLVGIVGTAVMLLFDEIFLSWLNLRGTFLAYGKTFASISAAGFVVQAVAFAVSQIIFSHGYTKVGMAASLVSNVVNLVINAVLIFGIPAIGIPSLGVAGAAIGGLVARVVYLLLLVVFLLRSVDVRITFRIFSPFPSDILRDVLRIGIPSVAENLSYTGSQLIITSFVAALGAVAVTSKSYYETVSMFTWATSASVAGGVTIMVGHMTGRGDDTGRDRVVKHSTVIGLLSTFAVCFVLFFTVIPLGRLFTDNQEILSLMGTIVFIDLFLELGRAVNMIVGSSLKATGDARYPLYAALVVQWLAMIPAAYLLCFVAGLGLSGIWIAIAFDEVLRAGFLYARWRSGRWMRMALVRLRSA
jgi:putative MATE family efflux protein